MILMHFPIKAPDAKQAGIISVVSPFDGNVVGSIETVGVKGVELAFITQDRFAYRCSVFMLIVLLQVR